MKAETFVDLRKLLERKDLDAISIATPDPTGTRYIRSGPVRRGRTSMLKSLCATTSAKAGKCLRLRVSTTA